MQTDTKSSRIMVARIIRKLRTGRDFGSLEGAIRNGMNIGFLGAETRRGLREYFWRLMGDCIEIREVDRWQWRPLGDLDGDGWCERSVFGERKNWHERARSEGAAGAGRDLSSAA
ncbi:MAG: hypothetical protein JXR83_06830 [Deltaproteobacteria bacterium]|nr:hypothetical protein [Deltaproteobacteria bacterium]